VEGILAILLIFGGGTAFLLAISPIGKAVADRISGAGVSQGMLQRIEESHLAVLEELEAVRQELAEVQERIDFAERLLAQQREPERLPRSTDQSG
jgi:Tfp pilus assembly protein PilO